MPGDASDPPAIPAEISDANNAFMVDFCRVPVSRNACFRLDRCQKCHLPRTRDILDPASSYCLTTHVLLESNSDSSANPSAGDAMRPRPSCWRILNDYFVPAYDDLDVLGIVHSVTNLCRQIDVLGAHTIVWSAVTTNSQDKV